MDNTLRKAAEMALEALLTCGVDYDYDENSYNTFDEEDVTDAIDALRTALAQPEQEPVAWKYDWYGHKSDKEPRALVKDWIASVYSEVSDPTIGAHNIRPLYTAPPNKEWVSLTDDEVHKIIDDCTSDEAEIEELIDFSIAILAVEAKLKEKNT